MATSRSRSRLLHWRRTLYLVLASVLSAPLLVLLLVAVLVYPDPREDLPGREQQNTDNNIVNDVTGVNPVQVGGIVAPTTLAQLSALVRQYQQVSIGGGRYSMGGQTASPGAVQIDMREFREILAFSPEQREITVQAGIRWRDIQDYIDPYGLAVKIMQSYSTFTVGGSLSVNAHGRYVGLGPLILSVRNLRLVLADGSIVDASPTRNSSLFHAVIGGMGGIAVIAEATLELVENTNVERSRTTMPAASYVEHFQTQVRAADDVVFHNADLYPPHFTRVSAVSWRRTDKPPTQEERLVPRERDYWLERVAWVVMSEWPFGRAIREYLIDPVRFAGPSPVHTRNYEASYDVAELEPRARGTSTYMLQEYFVPVARFDEWLPRMKQVFDRHRVDVLNVSVRHALADSGSLLAWAREECFSFVVYYKQDTDAVALEAAGTWTRELIDAVLAAGGTYYLPYQTHATVAQFQAAYPGAQRWFEVKQQYDPANKFTNMLWDKYYQGPASGN